VNVNQLFAPHLVTKCNTLLYQAAAQAEVSQGIYHIVELFLPSRNILQLYLWWQYLRVKYMLDQSPYLKTAFLDYHQKILTVVHHQYCPQIIRQGYQLLVTFLAKQVALPSREESETAGGGGLTSMLSKCTIC
jgi:hypothetical protein